MPKMLSIVTGSVQRITSLQRMINSVREQMPHHISYEIVVVDGGSTDGTQRWCKKQPDIRLIEHGELRGAIRAFCDGARAASGEYVVMANDDIIFQPYSLLRAVSYLETHRTCGAVAFADNRHSQMTRNGNGHRVMHMPAVGLDDSPVTVHYAQVGMFRRWLGEQVGWWGDQDPVMGRARTYGGDNYLSSRLWELGYSVDAVEGCAIDDLIERDSLRAVNAGGGEKDSAQYYSRFPRGAQLQPYPRLPSPQRERMRLVLMDIHEKPAAQEREEGLAEALARVGLLAHVDYLHEEYDLPALVRAWQPHALITQMHDTDRINAGSLSAARAACPSMVVINWNGDAHEKGLVGSNILEALEYVDLQTVVNAKVLPVYEAHEIPAAYWQIGYKDPVEPFRGDVPAWDVLWLGNCYNDQRYRLVETLRSTGYRVGVYGHCPDSEGVTHYDFARSRALYEHCAIAVSDTYPGTEGFVSNRLFQALSSGAFVLQQRSKRLDELTGLKAGTHYVQWTSLKDLDKKLRLWMEPARGTERRKIAEAGCAFVRENFSYDAQVRKLWELLP